MTARSVTDVRVFGYYDGPLCGYVTVDGQLCWFDIDGAAVFGDEPRIYTLRPLGEVVGLLGEAEIRAAVAS